MTETKREKFDRIFGEGLTEEEWDNIERKYSNLLFFPAIALHEFFHFLPATLLGCNPKMHISFDEKAYTEFETRKKRDMKVIGILPTVMGVLALPLVVPSFSLSPVGVYLFFSWALMTCPSLDDIALILKS